MGHIWKEEGQKYIPSSDLYSLKQALQDTTMIMDREKVEASLLPGCQKDAYTQVSANDIRKELNERGIADNNLVFLSRIFGSSRHYRMEFLCCMMLQIWISLRENIMHILRKNLVLSNGNFIFYMQTLIL